MRRADVRVFGGGLAAVAAAFVFARVQGGFVPWFVFYFVFAAFLYEVVVWQRGARTVRVERTLGATHVAVGQTVEVSLRVERRGWWPVLWLRVIDPLPPGLRPAEGRAEWWLVPLWMSVREIRYHIWADQRGIYQLPPIRVETGDLFGLQRRGRETGTHARLVVFPAVAPVHCLQGRRYLPAETYQATVRRAEESTEIAGVREWLPGDRLNRVHWPTTARQGRLQSKAFELQAMGGWVFLVDALRSSYAGASDERFELAMSIAASLVRRAAQAQWPAQLWLAGGRWRELPVAAHPAARLEALEQLAAAVPDGTGTWAERLSQALSRLPRNATLVVVSPQVTDAAVAVLAEFRARHAVEWFVPEPPGSPAAPMSAVGKLTGARVRVHTIRRLPELAIRVRGGEGHGGMAPTRA
jgi:uncharacterized protein (DUF58 family)